MGTALEDFEAFKLERARDDYDEQLSRSARLAQRGSTGAAYAIPLLSGALYYLASRCLDAETNLGTLGIIELVVLLAAVPVGVSMAWWLYVAGFKVHEYQVLPHSGYWYSVEFDSFEAPKGEFVAHLVKSAKHNRSLNVLREEAWESFVTFAGVATGLVVVAAFLDLVRSAQ